MSLRYAEYSIVNFKLIPFCFLMHLSILFVCRLLHGGLLSILGTLTVL